MSPTSQRLLSVLSSAVVLVFLTVYLSSSWTPLNSKPDIPRDAQFHAPHANPWAELTTKEADDIYTFIYSAYPELNLTSAPHTGEENHINFVELLRPNKTDTLPFLAGDPEKPQRYAKVAITQTIDEETYVLYHMLGPLPVSDLSDMVPLTFPFPSGLNYVKNPVPSYGRFQQWGMTVGANITDITQELLGATVKTEDAIQDPDTLRLNMRPTYIKNGTIEYWISFMRPGPHSSAWSILPQGLYAKVQTSNKRHDDWTIIEWYYSGVFYATADELRHAMRQPGFEKAGKNLDGDWTEIEDFDAAPPGRELPPPVMIQPSGARYSLDKKEGYVSWMGFEFYIASSQTTGPALFDIKFNGDSVMYELGLQEAMAHYAGDDPIQGGQEFLDTFFGMGKYAFELVPGYDCPAYADYLSTTYHISEQPWTNPNGICVFEYTADHLLQRHTSQYQVSLSRQTYLVVRSVSTVGNYDYTIDYTFYLDGTIEVKVRASGFIFAAFFNTADAGSKDKYGYRVHDAAATSMHDHVINFKADLDIVGPSNSFVRVAIEPTTRSYPWEQPEVPVRNSMTLVNHPLTHESPLDWPKNSAMFYTVYHASATNAWGERRGYRITPGTGMGTPPRLTIKNSTTMGASARWSEHDVWVLKAKDTEPRSADPLNYLSPHDPIVDFTKLANGEEFDPVDGDDLVLYFNLGAHHVPHAGDIPNTLMHTSASSVMFVPHNFHDRDPSRRTVQGVRLGLKGKNGAGWSVPEEQDVGAEKRPQVGDLRGRDREFEMLSAEPRYFGARYEEGVVLGKEALEPDLKAYDRARNEMTDLSFNGSVLGVWA